MRFPRVATEPLWWAFLSGLGANPIFGGMLRVVFLWLAPIVFPPTQQRPEWLTPNNIIVAVGALAAGAVLMRAGGVVAFALYIGYEILRVFAALPGRQLFCANVRDLSRVSGCDVFALLTERWVTFVALLIGAAIGLVWLRTRDGENGLLRAAGAFSFVLVVVSTLAGLVFLGRTDQTSQNATLALFSVANLLAGAAAGVLLARHRLAAAVLLAVLIAAPGVSVALPLAEQAGNSNIAFAFRWSGVYVPALAVLALIVTRGYVRRGDGGTFF